MYTATAGIALPTTIIGSPPRPGWYTENLGRRNFREAMVDRFYREQYLDAASSFLRDQETAGLGALRAGARRARARHGERRHAVDLRPDVPHLCFIDSVSIMVITLPFAIPVIKALGGDPIWFGVVAVVAIEIGLLTPPFGIAVYVVKSTLDDQRVTLHEIFAGAFPFVIVMALVTLLLVFVPGLSLMFK
jgi:hypothetical protein